MPELAVYATAPTSHGSALLALAATVYVLPPGPVHVPGDTDVTAPRFPDCPLPAVRVPARALDTQVTVVPVTPSWMTNVAPLLSGAVQLPPGLTVQVAVAAAADVAARASPAAVAPPMDRIRARRFLIDCPRRSEVAETISPRLPR
jgi:hypothetical protein